MIPTLPIKFTFFVLVVLYSFDSYVVKCEYSKVFSKNKESSSDIDGLLNGGELGGGIVSNENDDFVNNNELLDSDESELNEAVGGLAHTNLDYISKLKLLELFLNEIKKRQHSLYNVKKRSFLRAMKDSERKRPGWELAYGKRKRSTN